jgi:Fe-S cluster assembly ATP-binding protein
MLKIKNLHAEIEGKKILKGINLDVKPGEIHAIMGPNGSGKSTLASVLTGRNLFTVTKGEVEFLGQNLLEMEPEELARKGLFLSFQYPVEIPGVSMTNFMKTAVNQIRKYQGKKVLSSADFLKFLRERKSLIELDTSLTNRSVNEGFSGGEKKEK